MTETQHTTTEDDAHVVDGATGALPTSRAGLLAEVRENDRRAHLAAARKLELAAHFADLNSHLSGGSGATLPGAERMVQLGHDGTPVVAEFSTLSLGTAMRTSPDTAQRLIADALDLRHRMPHTWQLVMTGELDAWKARDLVKVTAPLDVHVCRHVDGILTPYLASMAWPRLIAWAKALVLQEMDVEQADDLQARAMASRHVHIGQSHVGVSDISGTVSAADAIHLNATLNWVADILHQGGNTNTRDVRRAQALGVLAAPARALQLMQASLVDQLPNGLDHDCPRQGSAGHTCGTITVDPDKLLPKAEMFVHLSQDTLADGGGIARLGDSGAMLAEWASELLDHHRVTLRPVIDCRTTQPVDAYEVPTRMRRIVSLRSPFEAFPWSKRPASRCDMDHVQPYQWTNTAAEPVEAPRAPSGQTHPDNLAPLGRRAHRAKTHTTWRYTMPIPGICIWTSPEGAIYAVTPSGTHELHTPTWPVAPPKTDWGRPPQKPPHARTKQARRGRKAPKRTDQGTGHAPDESRQPSPRPPEPVQPALIA